MLSVTDFYTGIQGISRTKWNIHETVLCRELCIKANDHCSIRDQLSQHLEALRKGGTGNKKKKTWVPTGMEAMDLGECNISNEIDMHYIQFGQKEMFASSRSRSNKHERMFR